MTQEDLVYRPEVLAEYGFRGTPDDLMGELRNGMQLHREGVSYAIWHALTPQERAIAVSGEAIRDTTPQREREALLVREFQSCTVLTAPSRTRRRTRSSRTRS